MLTLYVMPATRHSFDNLKSATNSWKGDWLKKVHVLPEGGYDTLFPKTKWKGFIYSDEMLSEGARESLEMFLSTTEFDYLSLYRKSKEGKFSIAPRIFRSGVELTKGAPYPVDIDSLRGTTILDGWILEQE